MAEFEPNYLRKTYRINLPAKVIIDGKEFEVVDWSFEGFGIKKNPEHKFDKGKDYTVSFILPFASFNVSFTARAKLNWQSDTRAGFEFIALSDETKQILRQYVEAYIEGRLKNVGGMLAFPEMQTVPPQVEVPLSDEERKKLDRKLKVALLIYGSLALLVAFVIYLLFITTPKVYSVEAFYSGTLVGISSPERGFLKRIYVKEGDTVHKGKPLVLIESPDFKKNIALYREKRKSIEDRVLKLKADREKLVTEIRSLLNRLEALKKEREILRESVRKLSMAYSKGFISKKELDDKVIRLAHVNKAIKDISGTVKGKRKVIELINREIASLKLSVYVIGVQDVKAYPNVRVKQNGYDIEILSPVKGYVVSTYKKPGELIKQNEVILSVEDLKQKGHVIGRFKKKEAVYINVGDAAEVYFPSLNVTVKGKVVAVGKAGMRGGDVGSETEEYALTDVPVRIALDKLPEGVHHGTKAEVAVVTKHYRPFIFRYFSRLLE